MHAWLGVMRRRLVRFCRCSRFDVGVMMPARHAHDPPQHGGGDGQVTLGNIVIKDKQRAPYLSVQVGF